MSVTVHKRFLEIVRREMLRMAAQPVYLFSMIIAPIFCFVFFSTLMDKGLPTNLPAGVVDFDERIEIRGTFPADHIRPNQIRMFTK